MLDELMEYKQYTNTFDGEDQRLPLRLKYYTFITQNRTGLNRALTIIARHTFFNKKNGSSGIAISEEGIQYVRDVLRSWLGFRISGDTDEYMLKLQNWLPRYYEKVKNENHGINSKIKKVDGQLRYVRSAAFETQMEKPWYDASDENDKNKITLDRIVANSIKEGRLKKYYMVCNKRAYEKAINNVTIDSGGDIKKKNSDVILKLTAYYLLTCKKRGVDSDASCFVPMCQGDFINWLKNEKCRDKEIPSYRYNGEQMFDSRRLDNTKMLRLNRNWINDCKWRLVEAIDEENAQDSYLPTDGEDLYFVDKGSGALLEELVSI